MNNKKDKDSNKEPGFEGSNDIAFDKLSPLNCKIQTKHKVSTKPEPAI